MLSFSRENITMFLVVICVFGLLYMFREVQKMKYAQVPTRVPSPPVPSSHEFMMMRQQPVQPPSPPPPPPTPIENPVVKNDVKSE